MKPIINRLVMYYKVAGFKAACLSMLGKLLSRQFEVRVKPASVRYTVSLRVPSSDVPTFREVFELREYEFPEVINPKVIVDAGANVGLAAVYFANRYPEALIIALEPEIDNFNCLVSQAAPYANIKPINCALWKQNESVVLSDPGLGKWAFETRSEEGREEGSARFESAGYSRVEGRTLESIMSEYSLGMIDLLKLDIEGAEADVLENSDSWIRKVSYLVAELHESRRKGCEAAYARATTEFARHWRYGGHVYAARN